MAAKLVVTGANSALGRVLIERASLRPDVELAALVRSARAESELPPLPRERASALRVDWSDTTGLREACAGASGLIHLAGILIESRDTDYRDANVETVRAAVGAARAAGVAKVVLVSAIGADPDSHNPYWRSKGEAEMLVRESGLAYTILRCPLVLACLSQGVRALMRESGSPVVPLPGGGLNLEQPIDARDLSEGALNAALSLDCAGDAALESVGPESLPLRELVQRAARLRGKSPWIVPMPTGLLLKLLELRTRLLGPGISPEVMEVMLTDARLDPEPAAKALGIRLRPLDETLAYSLELASAV
ncbi:MAG: SDR family oxidoreductase [bacterium]